MIRATHRTSNTIEEARGTLAAGLQARQSEIEEAVWTRVNSISNFKESVETGYLHHLQAAVSAAVDLSIVTVQVGERRIPPTPIALLVQARTAARYGVNLDTVLHNYFSSFTLISDFIMQEADRIRSLGVAEVQCLLRDQAALLDRLVPIVTEEYKRESRGHPSASEKRAQHVRRLLAGELLDTSELAYDLDMWHLGVLAIGPAAQTLVADLASTLDRFALIVLGDDDRIWAWLGGRSRLDSRELEHAAAASGVTTNVCRFP